MKWLDNFLVGNPLLRIVPPPIVVETPKTPHLDEIDWKAERKRLRAELAAAMKQRDKQIDYSIALQRAIEHHRRGVAVPPQIAANCPHHAQMLNEHLAQKEGGGA